MLDDLVAFPRLNGETVRRFVPELEPPALGAAASASDLLQGGMGR
jgi:hypothetical protein